MKRTSRFLRWMALISVVLAGPSAFGTIFTSDTTIGVTNVFYDGADIAVSNATLTVDGPHAFASLSVLNGGVLTHTAATNGILQISQVVTGEVHIISQTNPVTLNLSNALESSISVWDQTDSTMYTNGMDYLILQIGFATEIELTTNTTIADGSTILVNYNTLTTVPSGLNLVVSGPVLVAPGGVINANGRGYGLGYGLAPGHSSTTIPPDGSGGGHAGDGGMSSSNAPGGGYYDSLLRPVDKGSAGGAGTGGPGGLGGGAIQIVAGGTFEVDGVISADGFNATNSRSGGGAGGSVLLSAPVFAGAGLISANGGAGEPIHGGGGGGGFVALYFGSNWFTGSLVATGGVGFVDGGAGIVYTRDTNQPAGQVVIDNGGGEGTNTTLNSTETVGLTVRGGARAATIAYQSVSSLLVESNSFIMSPSTGVAVTTTVTGNATIEAGGMIVPLSSGTTAFGVGGTTNVGTTYAGGGGGYGGQGGASGTGAAGGAPSGSLVQPQAAGGRGGLGNGPTTAPGRVGFGGGTVSLTVGGTLELDGGISANGTQGTLNTGGGAGGSIQVMAGSFAGAGTITADGGPGNHLGGGGGGGRISITCRETNSFAGSITAFGGPGASPGGAGTIFIQDTIQPQSAPVYTILVDNDGQIGAPTTLGTTPVPELNADLTVTGGASLIWPNTSPLGLRNFLVASNCSVFASNATVSISIPVSGNATIEAGARLSSDGGGYGAAVSGLELPGSGPGPGRPGTSPTVGGGGGGNGGVGGSSPLTAAGGVAYGVLTGPIDRGSPGGNAYPEVRVIANSAGIGGNGGGAVHLIVSGLLQLDGQISANGNPGGGTNAGGGSGGSLWISARTLAGGGSILANGGAGGLPLGGGGAGGRISIGYATNIFAGSVSAFGGGGAGIGGAGTIYLMSSNSIFYNTIIADNGGQVGTNTTLGTFQSTEPNIIVQGGAVLTLGTTIETIDNLLVASNSVLLFTNEPQELSLTFLSNLVVEAGGAIIADGAGNPMGKGTGAGVNGTGGGYGGFGGAGLTPVSGGGAYGSVAQPTDLGSGGGLYGAGVTGGSAGGGSLRFSVNGTLQVDGRISANGTSAGVTNGAGGSQIGSAGGGSGGSIWLLPGGLFSGAGTISANGGAGFGANGGGGGGGRIAITSSGAGNERASTNAFTGNITAYGGSGSRIGGAGTIFYAYYPTAPSVIINNGGQFGTNTALGSGATTITTVTVSQGAVLSGSGLPTLGTLLVGSNGFVLYPGSAAQPAQLFTLDLGRLVVQPGGVIIADGGGSPAGNGTGFGLPATNPTNGAGGGGYGGLGGSGTGGTGGGGYGSMVAPQNLGSGGGLPYTGIGTNGGGNGGGSIRVLATTSVQVDGRISANGFAGGTTNAGGGSGGSIWISAGTTFSGSGIISANGGAGGSTNAGGGGGGRIAITYNDAAGNSSTNTNFVGTVTAYGGPGATRGGAGTIYLAGNANQASAQIIIDNGGLPGAFSTLGTSGSIGADLTLSGAGVLAMPGANLQVNDLTVGPGATMLFTNVGGVLAVTRNAIVQAGGAISGSPTATSVSRYTSGNGGPALLTPTGFAMAGGGGGGYGGFGSAGSGAGTIVVDGGARGGYGGSSFGTALQPVNEGGSGAPVSQSPATPGGGVGGLPVQLSVGGTLTLNGRISSDGGNGNAPNSGGGAGGAVQVRVGALAGNGIISANGGNGNGLGGSGGGGRIVLSSGFVTYGPTSVSNTFTGIITAYGGSTSNSVGGAGTIYTNLSKQQVGQLVVDNGGHLGTNTFFPDAGNFDLIVQNGGALVPPQIVELRNLLVASNGWVIVSNQTLSISGAADVQAGGGIIADGRGYPGGQGPGSGTAVGLNLVGSGGGGFGGNGGPDANGIGGGHAYGFTGTTAVLMGSGGGAEIGSNAGAGGGIVNIQMLRAVPGTLTVDGIISANGAPNNNNIAGAGSGGSVALQVASLSGSGVISADGGSAFGSGGGGAGGRIFITAPTNQFAGTMHAYGGAGAIGAGGAGTIDIGLSSSGQSGVIVDNGGQTGATTPVTLNFPGFYTILGHNVMVANGAIAYPYDPFLTVSNLTIGDGGLLIGSPTGTNLQLLVYSNVEVEAGGAIAVDAQGNAESSGPGAGVAVDGAGSGGGYGGMGGDSLTSAPGGASYGSPTQPTDLGSGGGSGSGPFYTGGSEGGGALRMDVGGALNVDGVVSANGNPGFQDNSGGGSGGSIWITASIVTGAGTISADGGEGELYGGGGGAGGRVAVYQQHHTYHTNTFLGLDSAFGADGANFGEDGTVFFADVAAPQVLAQSPSGIVSNVVSAIILQFSGAIDLTSVTPNILTLVSPAGVTQSVVSVSMLEPSLIQLGVPTQTANGTYNFTLAPQVRNLYGQTMEHAYTGSFTIELPTISGTVTDTNGLPLAGITLQSLTPVASTAMTDTNGFYQMTVYPNSTFTVVPSSTNAFLRFAPASRNYTVFNTSVSNENYVAYTGIAPSVAGTTQDTNFMMNFMGLQGVTYQIYSSTNLVDWAPYGPLIYGSNAIVQVPVPESGGPQQYFRVQANQ